MNLQQHAEALRKVIEQAEADGFEVHIKARSCHCCNDGVWITNPNTGDDIELYVY